MLPFLMLSILKSTNYENNIFSLCNVDTIIVGGRRTHGLMWIGKMLEKISIESQLSL